MNDLSKPIQYLSMQTVSAVFPTSSGTYSYFVPLGDDPKPGDCIITSVQWDVDSLETDDELSDAPMTNRQLAKLVTDGKMARIVRVDTHPNPKASKFYMQLVPLQKLRERYIDNRNLIKQVQERKEILAKLDTLLLQQSKIEHYRRMAETNPEAAELLKKLEG